MTPTLEHCIVVFDPYDNGVNYPELLDVEIAERRDQLDAHVAAILEDAREAAKLLGLTDIRYAFTEPTHFQGRLSESVVISGSRETGMPGEPESVHDELVLGIRSLLAAHVLEL